MSIIHIGLHVLDGTYLLRVGKQPPRPMHGVVLIRTPRAVPCYRQKGLWMMLMCQQFINRVYQAPDRGRVLRNNARPVPRILTFMIHDSHRFARVFIPGTGAMYCHVLGSSLYVVEPQVRHSIHESGKCGSACILHISRIERFLKIMKRFRLCSVPNLMSNTGWIHSSIPRVATRSLA